MSIQSYGLLFTISTVVAVVVLAILLKGRDQNAAPAIDLVLLLVLGHVIVARVFYAVLAKDWNFFADPSLRSFQAGFWGGQLGFALLGGLYLLWTRAPFRPLTDALAVTWAFISVPQKIGCYLAGCCYGSETKVFWAVVFPVDSQCRLAGKAIHPTQLYDAALALVLAIGLLALYRRRIAEGRLLLWWGLLYAVTKYATEWTRGDGRFLIAGPMSAAMLVEVVMAVLCAFLLSNPGAWNFLLALRDRRTAAARVPPETIRRGMSFAMTVGNMILALFVAGVAAGKTAKLLPMVSAFVGYYAVVSLLSGVNPLLRVFGVRVVDRSGARPSLARLLVRGLVASMTLSSFWGLFRPLLDRWGRDLGDAAAGTWVVRCVRAGGGLQSPASSSLAGPP